MTRGLIFWGDLKWPISSHIYASPPLFREVRQHMFCLTECSGQTSIYNLFISYPRSYHFMFILYLESDTVRQQASMPGLSIILHIRCYSSLGIGSPGPRLRNMLFDMLLRYLFFFCCIMFILYFWERQHWQNWVNLHPVTERQGQDTRWLLLGWVGITGLV